MNVFDASIDRIRTIFNEFDNVYVSFSGGKDSGVLLNLCIDFIRRELPNRKLGVFHIDYEAQYQMTTDYVEKTLKENSDILDVYHICLPLSAQCAASMYKSYWIPWNPSEKNIWVRPMPSNVINEENQEFPWFKLGMSDYDLQLEFTQWLHLRNGAKRTACLVGIRTQESLNRWRSIHGQRNKNKFKNLPWTRVIFEDCINCYPIFDWKTEDVWIANYRNKWSYNSLYDLFYQANVPLDMMRVASPFNDAGIHSLRLYKAIDPNNWARMIGRVDGVNFAGLYGGTVAMGWKNIILPKGHTWESYMHFLLSTLPPEVAKNYQDKLNTSKKFWRNVGGCLSFDVIKKLEQNKVKFKVGIRSNRKTDKIPIIMDYLDDIDIEEFQQIPTYKRMCICIMKNDFLCKFMGFSPTKTESERRYKAESKYSKVWSNNGKI